jgi:ABC-type branched-subunit amino acid transport system ATPase component
MKMDGQTPQEDTILDVQNLSRSFGGLRAVQDVTFRVQRGSVHAIIGPNGAGKTTLFNLITGLVRPDRGRVLFEGRDVTGLASWRLVRRGVGRSFQQANLFWALPSIANVTLPVAAARGETRRVAGRISQLSRRRAAELLVRVGLADHGAVTASELSHGDQRSLELAAALAVESRLLLLDEPTAGLSPSETGDSIAMLKQLAASESLTVLFIEHDMEVVFGFADFISVLQDGKMLAQGTPDEVRRNSDVRRAYLGDEDSMGGP